ncbi:hypothetical protein M9H77_20033 [Catharanthus roseus]|uniref:Uncharacterized protein n=1 Tax=Catharanthus roseus TaxID=4058 RepID=A0ACC0AKC2_CATRO|nr:hypothetical protein M9H77_20033 [Catharanthus roseus]
MAANYSVGAPNGGWDLQTPIQAWANSQNFSVGDSLTFVYAPNHDVLEVTKTDYDACGTKNPVASYNGGMTIISLTSSGNRYFICGSQGHCDRGMKVVITTLGSSAAPPPATPSAPPPSAPSPATPATPPATRAGSPTASTPVNSPVPSKTTAPVHAPMKAPSVSPSKSPPAKISSPASSPAIPNTNSPAIPPFPGASSPSTTPSSASKISGLTMGLGSVIMMLLTL